MDLQGAIDFHRFRSCRPPFDLNSQGRTDVARAQGPFQALLKSIPLESPRQSQMFEFCCVETSSRMIVWA